MTALGQIFTMEEAADRLRMSRRALQDLVKRHPFYFENGSRKLFTEAHLGKLYEAWKAEHPQHPDVTLSAARSRRGTTRAQRVVYLLRCGDFIKIGYSKNFSRRLEALRSTSPHDIAVITTMGGGISLERSLHARFASYRHHHEWFRHEGDLAEYIASFAK